MVFKSLAAAAAAAAAAGGGGDGAAAAAAAAAGAAGATRIPARMSLNKRKRDKVFSDIISPNNQPKP